eukprot:522615_1
MVGMVHFIRKETTQTEQSTSARSLKQELLLKESSAFAGLIGDTGLAEQIATKAANALSQTGIDVRFDLITQGYLPILESQKVIDSIKLFKEISPDKLDASHDVTLFPDMTEEQNMLIRNNKVESVRQSQSGAMIKSTIMGIANAYDNTYSILDYRTFMNAFDDYAKNVGKTKGNGVACGMNIKSWTKAEVRKLIERSWSPDSANETGYGSGQLAIDIGKKKKASTTAENQTSDSQSDNTQSGPQNSSAENNEHEMNWGNQ